MTFDRSKNSLSPKPSPRLISKEAYDRLLGKSSLHKHICSTNHNHKFASPALSQQKSLQQPLIKPRPLSQEKVLKTDRSLSPIEFDNK